MSAAPLRVERTVGRVEPRRRRLLQWRERSISLGTRCAISQHGVDSIRISFDDEHTPNVEDRIDETQHARFDPLPFDDDVPTAGRVTLDHASKWVGDAGGARDEKLQQLVDRSMPYVGRGKRIAR